MRKPRKRRSLLQRLALGAAAGAGATFVMQGLMMTSAKFLPDSRPPTKQDPGEFMIGKAKTLLPEPTRDAIPEKIEALAANALRLGYGMTSGVLYAAIRPRGGDVLIDGVLLGLGVWAAGYLGWLPAADLMPPITEHEPKQVAVPLVQHAMFGIAVVGAYDALL